MGGFVGLRLAIHRPELLRSLTLIDTSAEPEPAANLPRYRLLNLIARMFGIGMVVDRVMPILFGPSFLNDPARATERAEYRRRLAGNHRVGITRAVAGVIGRAGVADQLHRIRTPTLVLVGAEDSATPPEKAAALQRGIAGARMIVVPAAGHTSTLENPGVVTAAIAEFLAGFDAGEEVRR
jgi:pimeloyl-ACP methyl ester carboxylesterase